MDRIYYGDDVDGRGDNMILFSERYNYLVVLKGNFNPELSVTIIGDVKLSDGTWRMSFIGRNWDYYTDYLDGHEKRQIIGMIDKLNGHLNRPQEQNRARWEEIIRPSKGI